MKRLAVLLPLLLAGVPAAHAAGRQPLAGTNGVSLPALISTRPAAGGLAYDVPALLTDAYLARLRASGADLVRVVVRPAPMLTGSPAARRRALAQVAAMVRRLTAADLTAIVDPHFWPPDTPGDAEAGICDPAKRRALRETLLALADVLDRMSAGKAMLELLNEPRPCKVAGRIIWPTVQRELVGAIRARHRTLPVLVTGTWEGPDTLEIDPAPYRNDPAIFFSWHFYQPFVFTHQESYYHVNNVPWPGPGNLIAGMQAYAALDRSRATWGGANTLRRYLTQDAGAAAIHDQFAAVSGWTRQHRIDPARIVIGEYGTVFSDANAQLRPDQLRWLSAIRGEARTAGFRTIYWIMPLHANYDFDPRTSFLRADVARAIGLTPPR